MYVGRPIIFIGPKESYAGRILRENPGNIIHDDEDSKGLINSILGIEAKYDFYMEVGYNNQNYIKNKYKPSKLIQKMIKIIEN